MAELEHSGSVRRPRLRGAVVVAIALAQSACVGRIGGDDPSDGATKDPIAVSGMRRLTSYEYDSTLRDLLLDDVGGAALNLPADERTPFDNDYESQKVSQALVEGLDLLAGDAVDRLLADPGRRDDVVGCVPAVVHDEACFREFLDTFGKRALRRPLDPSEVETRVALLDFADEAGDFYFAVGLAIRSFLEDPSFVYRVELGDEVSPGVHRLDDWAVASRLSYLVWATMPDDELLAIADAGSLHTSEAVRAQATRMLADPRALRQIERFHALWMGYEGLGAGGDLQGAMESETDALFAKVIGEGRPWLDLFRWPETYVDADLATHYGLEPPPEGSAWVSYGETGRRGLLSQASFLAVGGQGEMTNPTTRGRLIRELILCEDVPPRPANVPPSFGGGENAICKTDKYAAHTQGGCASCHQRMDAIGFGLEQYDATGAFRSNEPDDLATDSIDESQCALATEGELFLSGDGEPFAGPGELGALLAGSEELRSCMARQLYRFAAGRSAIDDVDGAIVDSMVAHLSSPDFAFDELIVDLVSRETFLYRRDTPEEN